MEYPASPDTPPPVAPRRRRASSDSSPPHAPRRRRASYYPSARPPPPTTYYPPVVSSAPVDYYTSVGPSATVDYYPSASHYRSASHLRPTPATVNPVGSFAYTPRTYRVREIADKKPVLEWLSPLEPSQRQRAIGIDRVAGVGSWFLLANQFIQWSEGGRSTTTKPVLFCYGDPGVGKTYLRYVYLLLLKTAGEAN